MVWAPYFGSLGGGRMGLWIGGGGKRVWGIARGVDGVESGWPSLAR